MELKINDIRIGNYLLKDGEAIMVNSIYLASDDLYDINGYYIGNYKPIDLTENILIKCGFKQEYNEFWYGNGTISISLDTKGVYVIFGNSGREIKRHGILYLHQLQNLYRSLTSRDFKINFLKI